MENSKYKGKIFEIFEKDVEAGERTVKFEIARRAPGTRLIIPKEGMILLTKEFRHELNGFDYRLPGGKVFDLFDDYLDSVKSEKNIEAEAEKAARKEALEEAGVVVKNIELFHKSVCGATVMWDLYYFIVKEFEETTQQLEEDEDIEVVWIEKEKAKEMCLNGGISEERSALVLLRYLENRG